MADSLATLKQLKKADKLSRLVLHKNGPKSYTRGQGALMRALYENGTLTQRDLVWMLGVRRSVLKDIVKKAERNGYVTIEETEAERTYAVQLTDEGREIAEKRAKAQAEAADDFLSAALTPEEQEQLNVLTEKIILAAKDAGISAKKKGYHAHRKGHHCSHR